MKFCSAAHGTPCKMKFSSSAHGTTPSTKKNYSSAYGRTPRKIIVLLLYCVCVLLLHILVTGLLARSQYPEGPATSYLGTGFSWFPCVYKRMLRRFSRLPSCYSMLLMQPYRLKFVRSLLHMYAIFISYLCTCKQLLPPGDSPFAVKYIITIIPPQPPSAAHGTTPCVFS